MFSWKRIMQVWNTIVQTLTRKPGQPGAMASTTAPSSGPGPDASWRDQVLHACSVGNIKLLVILLDERDEKHDPTSDALIAEMMGDAVRSKQPDTLRFLLDYFPEFPEQRYMLSQVHNPVFIDHAGLPMYKVLVERYPFLQDWDLGELGDHLGSVALTGDLEFARYLLEHGADASRARMMHSPVLRWLNKPNTNFGGKNRQHMIKLLKDHGASEDRVMFD